MKINIVLKNFICLSAVFLLFILSTIFCQSSAAEDEWRREFGATVNDEYLAGAYDGGSGVARPALVDIDNDGDFDLFVGTVNGSIHFYRNDGTPNAPVWILVTDKYNSIDVGARSAPTFCDIDNDGDYDMFIGKYDGNINFYRNDGTHDTPLWILITENYNLMNVGRDCAPTFSDIDSDGDYDMFIGEYDGNINFYRNDGTPADPYWILVTANYNSLDVGSLSTSTFCDIDNDGDYDMFIGREFGNIYFYRNDGTPTSPLWIFVTNYYSLINVGLNSVPTFCDIDNDGDYDLFIGENYGNIIFYQNDGTSRDALWTLGTKNYTSIDVGINSAATFCDIDNDGDYDIFIGEHYGKINFYRNDGTPTFPVWTFVTGDYNSIDVGFENLPAFCDIDNDGDYDMFIGEIDGNINFYRNDGTPTSPFWILATEKYNSIDIGVRSTPAFCDIDADGDYDMFIGEQYGRISFYRNDGTPTIPVWKFITGNYNSIDVGYQSTSIFCDVDNDGDHDMFIGEIDGNINFYRNDGTPASPLWVLITENFNSVDVDWFSTPVFCDIDMDSDYDMFVGGDNGGINFWRNMAIDNEKDADEDTIPDYWEVKYWGDITIINDPHEDYDGDGMLNIDEYVYGKNPTDPYDFIDIYPPSPVTDFIAQGALERIELSWLNSVDLDWIGTMIIRKEEGYPQDINDGVMIYNGTDSIYLDIAVAPGKVYYYTAFSYDEVPNYSHAAASAQGMAIAAERPWQREYEASVNGENISGAYFGGLQNARPVFVDIDADGDFDMFVGEMGHGIHFYRNDGTPTSPSWTFITRMYGDIGSSGALLRPAFCDIDNDGDFDMFIGGYSESIGFCRNDGTPQEPSWTLVNYNYLSKNIYNNAPVFCDIDADGDYDLFVGEWGGNILFYRNDGSATFPFWNLITENYNSIDVGYDSYPTFCDIDGDNDYDMFIGGSEGNVYFYRNDGTPNSAVWILVDDNYSYIDIEASAPAFCDIDTDGDYDMFVGESDGHIIFYNNNGTSTLPSWTLTSKNYTNFIDVGNSGIPALCDIDNDGDYDLFIGRGEGGITFYCNDGTRNTPLWRFVTGDYNSTNTVASAPSFCDIDNDGDYDMFVGEGYGHVYFYRNDGTPLSPSWIFITDSYNDIGVPGWCVPSFCDIDKDGDYDMFVGNGYSGYIYFYRNDGTPELPSWMFVTSYYNSTPLNNSNPDFCDIDNDSDYDMFIGGYFPGQLQYYRNNGTAESPLWTLITEQYNNIGLSRYNAPTFCDIDNDGDYDMFIGEYNGGINFWRNMTVDHLKDEDLDTLPDYWEIKHWGDITTVDNPDADYDGDRMRNIDEYTYATDPTNPDDWVDITPPGVVTDFIAQAEIECIELSWINPSDVDWVGTVIVRKEGDYPRYISDGILIYNGTDSAYVDTKVFPGVTYYYTAFAYDERPNNSQAVPSAQGMASPLEIPWQREYGAMVDGEFLAGAYIGGARISKPAFVDIDCDKDLDLFIGMQDGTMRFYRNDGTANSPSWTFITGDNMRFDRYCAPTFCDIDGDGDYDMFIGRWYGSMYFYRNDGTSTSPSWVLVDEHYSSLDVGDSSAPTFCDIDNDGDFDMFMGEGDGNINFYRNDGTSNSPSWTFVTANYASIDVGSSSAPAFCDIDKDGDYDMFIGEWDGNINFYRNDGIATAPSWVLVTENYNSIDAGYYSAPNFCDINNDGNYDMFVGESINGIDFYRNDGIPTNPYWIFVTDSYDPIIDIGIYNSTTFCDIDNDGDFDMFMGEGDGNINFYRNDGTSNSPSWTFVTANYASIDVGSSSAPTFCDIDGDGDYDMFIGEGDGNINFYRNDGTSAVPLWMYVTDYYDLIKVIYQSAPTFCDIDGDGDRDIFIGDGNGNISFYRNDGTPNSPSWTFVTESYNGIDMARYSVPTFCDIDSDRDYDLFVGEYYSPISGVRGQIHFYRNDGTPNSPSWTLITDKYNLIFWGDCTTPTFCDIDGDGDYDAFIGEADGGINFWRNMTITDTTPPVTIISISGTSGNEGWYTSHVQIILTAQDNEGGLGVTKTEYSFDSVVWNTYAGAFTISAEGATTLYYKSTDNAGNTEEVKSIDIKIDKTAPQVTITTPANGSEYILGSSVIANWTATDDISGIDTASGTVENGGTIAMSNIGVHSFNVAATDKAGNQTTKTSTYYVRYSYSGVLQPINPDGTSVFKLGRVVPVKFRLQNASGAFISTANARIYLAKISNDVVGDEIEAEATGNANTGNLFRYDSMDNQYIFNLGTKGLSAGTWQIRIVLDDGTSHYTLVSLR